MGLLGRKVDKKDSRQKYMGNKQITKTLADMLKDVSSTEPAYVASWGVPIFRGDGSDHRKHVFIFYAFMGESDAPEVEAMMRQDPEILRETGYKIFPELFAALPDIIDSNNIPHYLWNNRTELTRVN